MEKRPVEVLEEISFNELEELEEIVFASSQGDSSCCNTTDFC